MATGVLGGGAESCVSCLPGTYSTVGSIGCSPCPAGSFAYVLFVARGDASLTTNSHMGGAWRCHRAAGNATTCDPCPAGTFQSNTGASSCQACGSLTSSEPGSTACSTNNCTVTLGAHTYDVSRLGRVNDMYGPIRDNNSQIYFLNMCARSRANHTCIGTRVRA